jgi:MoaA/NifB/PqqE/SkfB family radical SAM enzyme
MCSVEKYKKRDARTLDLEDYERLAKAGARLGAIAITVLGGEPFVFKKLPELLSIFKSHAFFCNVVTGGTLVSKDKLLTLKQHGLDSIFFSLESMNPETNDRIRGEGHFQRTMQNISWCRELAIRCGVATVFQPHSFQDAVSVVEFAQREHLLIAGSQVAATGMAEHAALLSDAQHDQIRSLVAKYPNLTLDWTMSYFLRQQCPAGKEKVGITCNGDVIGCSINSLSFGNVFEESLESIWKRMGRFSQFARHSPACLAAEDKSYIDEYLGPLHQLAEYPLNYQHHPRINRTTEPRLFSD